MSDKLKAIKKSIKNKTYDMEAAIKNSSEKIVDHPEALLWR